jgi:hypothetical protein
LQKATGTKVYVMRGDDQVIASGGKGQYMYTTDRWALPRLEPCLTRPHGHPANTISQIQRVPTWKHL